jgi:hypothetical protein
MPIRRAARQTSEPNLLFHGTKVQCRIADGALSERTTAHRGSPAGGPRAAPGLTAGFGRSERASLAFAECKTLIWIRAEARRHPGRGLALESPVRNSLDIRPPETDVAGALNLLVALDPARNGRLPTQIWPVVSRRRGGRAECGEPNAKSTANGPDPRLGSPSSCRRTAEHCAPGCRHSPAISPTIPGSLLFATG